MKRAMVAGALLALGACATPVYMYPANEPARVLGNVQVIYTNYGMGAGPIEFKMPDGEVLKGRYSQITGGQSNFGSLYGSVAGTGGYAAGSAFATSTSMSNSAPVAVDAQGPKSTAHCEAMVNNMNGHGNGVCEIQPGGARYRIQF